MRKPKKKPLLPPVAVIAVIAPAPDFAAGHLAAAQKWINDEFQPGLPSKVKQLAEMNWFIGEAEPFKGMEINVLSEPFRVLIRLGYAAMSALSRAA